MISSRVNLYLRMCKFLFRRYFLSIRSVFQLLLGFCTLVVCSYGWAGSYPLPADGDTVVGEIQYTWVNSHETLLDIARQYDLGFNEITAANPGIDPWLPKKGTRILLPTRYVLPAAPHKGIVVNLAEMRLYYFPKATNGEAKQVITHPVSIGQKGWATPVGEFVINLKIENPNWTMPLAVYRERVEEGYKGRRLVPAGPDNPLGQYAMQLNADNIYIHGTNKPYGIGMRVSRGCIRLYPEDIKTLIRQVPDGTPVHIVEQPYKFGHKQSVVYLEAHQPISDGKKNGVDLTPIIAGVIKTGVGKLPTNEWQHIVSLAEKHTGVPVPLFEHVAAALQATKISLSTTEK
jgi:L,D-transpeptidase ErfK/SrfK